MTSVQIIKDAKERMEKSLEGFRKDLMGLRTGRATPAMLDSIRAESYGSPTPIKQLATISCPDPTELVIKPFLPESLREIEKAIRGSDLGLAPNNDGKVIRLKIPPMSGDQRKKMVTQIKKLAEESKVSCRNIRRDGNKHFETAEKDKTMTEDDRDKGKETMQEMLKTYEAKLEELAVAKSKEIMDS